MKIIVKTKKELKLKEYSHIHCIGIGGIGLSGLAHILLEEGFNVSGSDMNESYITDSLIEKGATVYLGHRKKHAENADLIVYSSAVKKDNPELIYARENKIKAISRAELLGLLMDNGSESIAITGAHGKTTTTAMISKILIEAKKEPTILVGGNFNEIGGNFQIGKNDFFVTEACEYMDSFLELRPKNAVILNIDSDHLDYFAGIKQIVKSFKKFTENVSDNGILFAYTGNVFINDILKTTKKKVITFGHNSSCDFWVENINFNNKGLPAFDLVKKEGKLGKINLAIPGDHNIINALASIAVTSTLGISMSVIKKTLKTFKGVARRAEEKGETIDGVRLIDDYAHHPTEIEATLKAIKNIPHEKLWVIFQPHTYTRTLALYKDFAKNLSGADFLVLSKIYPAREQNLENITSEIIYNELPEKFRKENAVYIDNFEDIASFVKKNAKKNDIILTLSAGNLPEVCDLILEEEHSQEKHDEIKAVKIDD